MGNEQRRAPGRPRSTDADDAVLTAALDLIAGAGVEGVSIEQAAKRAGVARTTVYRRYATRDDLAIAALVANEAAALISFQIPERPGPADATYAVLCKGPYEQSVRYRDFFGLEMPWYSAEKTAPQLLEGRNWQVHHLVCYVRDGDRVFETYYTGGRGVEIMAPTHGLLDMTVYGRQEAWEDSPDGWPQPWYSDERPGEFQIDGRPIAQWARIEAGYSDDLT